MRAEPCSQPPTAPTSDHDGQPALLLETYGSADRVMPGKTSQSILLEESAAKELRRLIKKSF